MTNISFNKLSPSEAERLALLSEELAEAQVAIGKILRHGYNSHHPDRPNDTNRHDLEVELGDVFAAIMLLTGTGDLSMQNIILHKTCKTEAVWKYLHHNKREEPCPPSSSA